MLLTICIRLFGTIIGYLIYLYIQETSLWEFYEKKRQEAFYREENETCIPN